MALRVNSPSKQTNRLAAAQRFFGPKCRENWGLKNPTFTQKKWMFTQNWDPKTSDNQTLAFPGSRTVRINNISSSASPGSLRFTDPDLFEIIKSSKNKFQRLKTCFPEKGGKFSKVFSEGSIVKLRFSTGAGRSKCCAIRSHSVAACLSEVL